MHGHHTQSNCTYRKSGILRTSVRPQVRFSLVDCLVEVPHIHAVKKSVHIPDKALSFMQAKVLFHTECFRNSFAQYLMENKVYSCLLCGLLRMYLLALPDLPSSWYNDVRTRVGCVANLSPGHCSVLTKKIFLMTACSKSPSHPEVPGICPTIPGCLQKGWNI
jgi:hypothetical protein